MSNRAASCSRNARLLGDAASRRRKEGGDENRPSLDARSRSGFDRFTG